MKITSALFYCFLLLGGFAVFTGNTGCANIIPPSGGPRDTLPPVLVNALPSNGTLNFKGNKIVLTFDEFVEIKDKEKNLVINPTPKNTPTIEYKLKVVTIKLRDTLKPNTTYSIEFGRALRDINEGNVLKNFQYVFSTGPYLDSLQLSGNVTVAYTGKADSTLVVMLYSNLDDSAVVKERARFVTRVDTLGNFTFRYLPAGTYRLYALKDESNSREYLSKSQLFAFADSPIALSTYSPPVKLYAYAEEEELNKKTKKTETPASAKKLTEKEMRLQIQMNLKNGDFDVLDTLTLAFLSPLKDFDSTKFRFTDEQFKDIHAYRLVHDSTNQKLSLLYKWKPDSRYHIIADKQFATDTLGRKLLKTDTISFHTKAELEYGEVHLRFKNLDLSRNPVLLFLEGGTIKYSYPFKNREFTARIFRPGEYDLRILYDDNKNGVWDTGHFFGKHRQPEKVENIKITNSKHKLVVKANWDNDVDFTL